MLNASISDQVTWAYRILLGREPDPKGLAHYSGMIESGKRNLSNVIAILMDSPEFVKKRNVFGDIVELPYHGLTIAVPRGDFSHSYVSSRTPYEPHVMKPLMSELQEGMTFLDIGANVGLFAIPAAQKVGGHGHVYAVEASPRNALLLHMSKARNHLANLTILPMAASDDIGLLVVNNKVAGSNGGVSVPDAAFTARQTAVAAIPLDALMSKIEHVDVIKIDVEGHEYKALSGALNLIRRDHPSIYMEYSPEFQQENSGVSGQKLLKMIEGEGYRVSVLGKDGSKAVTCAEVDRIWQSQGGSYVDLCWSPLPARTH